MSGEKYLARIALISLAFLALYSTLWGIGVPMVYSGAWTEIGLPSRFADMIRNVPVAHLPAGYALVAAYVGALTAFIGRNAISLAFLAVGFLLHLVIWILLIGNPAANTEIGYLVILVEAIGGLALGTLMVRDYFKTSRHSN